MFEQWLGASLCCQPTSKYIWWKPQTSHLRVKLIISPMSGSCLKVCWGSVCETLGQKGGRYSAQVCCLLCSWCAIVGVLSVHPYFKHWYCWEILQHLRIGSQWGTYSGRQCWGTPTFSPASVGEWLFLASVSATLTTSPQPLKQPHQPLKPGPTISLYSWQVESFRYFISMIDSYGPLLTLSWWAGSFGMLYYPYLHFTLFWRPVLKSLMN